MSVKRVSVSSLPKGFLLFVNSYIVNNSDIKYKVRLLAPGVLIIEVLYRLTALSGPLTGKS